MVKVRGPRPYLMMMPLRQADSNVQDLMGFDSLPQGAGRGHLRLLGGVILEVRILRVHRVSMISTSSQATHQGDVP